jgi:hypothetical protein
MLWAARFSARSGQVSRGMPFGAARVLEELTMRLSRILLLLGAVTLPAVPALAQGKAIGRPAGVGKPTTTGVKGASGSVTKGKSADAKAGTLVKGKSADHAKGPKTTTTATSTEAIDTSEATGRGQLPLGEKIALNGTLKTRLDALLEGGTMTYEQATTGWKNQGQLVAAMNAAEHNPGISFVDLHAKMTGPGQPSVGQALTELKEAASTPPATETTPTTTTP